MPALWRVVHAQLDLNVCCERRFLGRLDISTTLTLTFNGCLTGGAQREEAATACYRILSVRMVLGGGVPAGLVGGRHTQPGSTRTPSPACGSGKQS